MSQPDTTKRTVAADAGHMENTVQVKLHRTSPRLLSCYLGRNGRQCLTRRRKGSWGSVRRWLRSQSSPAMRRCLRRRWRHGWRCADIYNLGQILPKLWVNWWQGPEKLCFKRVSCPFLSMDPAQFKEYTDGMAVLETTRTLRRHHEQCKQALIRQTTPCDGTSPAGVRAWLKDIELAGAEVGAENQIEIAARTAAGSLRYIAGAGHQWPN